MGKQRVRRSKAQRLRGSEVQSVRNVEPRTVSPERMALLIALGILLAGAAFADESSKPMIPSAKTLARAYDPLVISGNLVPSLEGTALTAIRLYAARQGELEVIPFQVDERSPTGALVLPNGPKARQDKDSGVFDYNDELVFMAKDAGEQLAPGILDAHRGRWLEIQVSDPLRNSDRAWVYIFVFSSEPPPLSAIDYVRYDVENETIYSDQYKLAYRPGYALYSDLSYPQGADSYGEDFLDRIKVRIEVKFLFNLLKIRKNEDDFKATVVAWKDGPIRVLRDVETYVRVLFNMSSPSVFAVTEFYPYHMYTPLRITIPFDLNWVFGKFGVSDWTWNFYGDLPGLKGGRMYSNRNTKGLAISPPMTRKWLGKNIDQRYLVWGYATREEVGTWFCNLVIPDAIYQYANLYLNIDENDSVPPEDEPGEIAAGLSIGFHTVDRELFNVLSEGTVEVGLETFFPPSGFSPEGVEQWRQIRQFPLMVSLAAEKGFQESEQETAVSGLPEEGPPPGRKQGSLARLTDVRGRQTLLYDAQLHIGSITATPQPWIIGEDVEKKKWYRVPFNTIKTLEAFYKEVDPLTGMADPLFHRITLRNGKVEKLMTCKPCSFGGYLPDGRKSGFWLSQIKTVEFLDAGPE